MKTEPDDLDKPRLTFLTASERFVALLPTVRRT